MPYANPIYTPPWAITAPTGGSGASLNPAPAANYNAATGGIPSVPNPAATSQAAIGADVGNMGSITGLGTQYNQFTQGGLLGAYNTAGLPIQQLIGQAAGNTKSLLGGTIPQDVQTQIAQQAAERGVMTGTAGSPNNSAALLRSLGLTSLDLQQRGLQNLGQLTGMTPVGKQFDPSQFYITPEDMQNAQLAANLYNAAPVPSAAQNAAWSALNRGLGAGYGRTAPSGIPSAPAQSQQTVSDILSRYAPTVGGTPSPTPYAPTQTYGDPNATATTSSTDFGTSFQPDLEYLSGMGDGGNYSMDEFNFDYGSGG